MALHGGKKCNHAECSSGELDENENCNKQKKECHEDIPCPGNLTNILSKLERTVNPTVFSHLMITFKPVYHYNLQ